MQCDGPRRGAARCTPISTRSAGVAVAHQHAAQPGPPLASLSAHAQSDVKTYIVQLKDEPAASYQGTTSGYAATQAAAGTPFSSHSAAAVSYSSYLRNKQAAVLSTVTANAPISQFDTVFNGFTARLTAACLQCHPGCSARGRRIGFWSLISSRGR